MARDPGNGNLSPFVFAKEPGEKTRCLGRPPADAFANGPDITREIVRPRIDSLFRLSWARKKLLNLGVDLFEGDRTNQNRAMGGQSDLLVHGGLFLIEN